MAQFLDRHWQIAPLVVRGAAPGVSPALTPEAVARLACRDDVDSRLVLDRGGRRRWEVRFGPFTPREFARLPRTRWTLLVQEVDRLVPEAAEVLEHFRFLPNWRIDDLMVSYAADGGSVGPHVDDYDVFLIQAWGRRRWRIGSEPVGREVLVPGLELRVLASFRTDRAWVLEPGDMLYLPPRVPHHGTAIGPCMTYSVGLRAPSHQDIVAGFLAHAVEAIDPSLRYADPDLRRRRNPGRVDPAEVDRAHRILLEAVSSRRRFAEWFGRFVTEPRREVHEAPRARPLTGSELVRALRDGAELRRSAVSRFAYVDRPRGAIELFVGGRHYPLARGAAAAGRLLCGRGRLSAAALGAHLGRRGIAALLAEICNRGFLVLDRRRVRRRIRAGARRPAGRSPAGGTPPRGRRRRTRRRPSASSG